MFSIILALVLFLIKIPIKTAVLAFNVTGAVGGKIANSLAERLHLNDNKGVQGAKKVVKLTKNLAKLGLKTLKSLLFFIRTLITLILSLNIVTTVITFGVTIMLIAAISSSILIYTTNNPVGNITASTSTSSSKKSNNKSNESIASDWKIVHQGDYAKVNYSTDSGTGGRGNVKGQGCGLCSIYVVSEHYTGNKGTFTIKKCAEELDKKFNNKCTNMKTEVVTKWFNEMHKEIGVTCTEAKSGNINLDELDKVLAAGGCAIVDYHSNVTHNGVSVWTTKGHYITIIGGNQKKGYSVRDSNGAHDSGTLGVKAWAPYNKHIFDKKYINPPNYYYYIKVKKKK